MKKRALISVSDKSGLVQFAGELHRLGYELISTGGTAKTLVAADIPVTPVHEVTGFPEIMDGRVKTLHPKIHGGILAERHRPGHMSALEQLGIATIDLVAVNLYPFERVLNTPGTPHEDIVENIDIGGPSMVRAAAKNYRDVIVIVDPADYGPVTETLAKTGEIGIEDRERLAGKAFAHTADYDTLIAGYFAKKHHTQDHLQISMPLAETLRYGENPHQEAAFFCRPGKSPLTQVHGRQLSYNNYLDIDAALKMIFRFTEPTVIIVKHTNPCGVASRETLTRAYHDAFATDTESPFGGIVAVNRPLDLEAATAINNIFTEIILAPAFDDDALAKLKKKTERRLLTFDPRFAETFAGSRSAIPCLNGFLQQDVDIFQDKLAEWKVATRCQPDDETLRELEFAWKIVAILKSNAVCFTRGTRTLGLGLGQTSRISSTHIALANAARFEHDLRGSVFASDGFFPFRDSIDNIAGLGVKAVIQPGGSRNDDEVIAACDEHGIPMIITGMRHFRH